MAQHASAKKRYRQSLVRRERNKHWLSTVRNAVRRVRRAAADDPPKAAKELQAAERVLRKAATKGVIHPRTVSRTVSRLTKLVASAS